MDKPKILSTGLEPVAEDGSGRITASRKTLHQNILGKLRPLPLQYHWTVWYEKHLESSNYDERLYILHEDVADIGTFYRVYNNYPWQKVKLRDTVHIFRKGTKPVWEDPENQKGGCWTFRVPKAQSQAFFHEVAILCMANEFQAALEAGTLKILFHLRSSPFFFIVTAASTEKSEVCRRKPSREKKKKSQILTKCRARPRPRNLHLSAI